MSQKGQIFARHGAWYVRYYDNIFNSETKSFERKRVTQRLGAKGEFRSKGEVNSAAERYLSRVGTSDSGAPLAGSLTLREFFDNFYLPHAKVNLRLSTWRGYVDLWRKHLLGKELVELRLREFRTFHGEKLLHEVAEKSERGLGKSALKHVKALVSGIFTYAKRLGAIDDANPMHGVSLPKARKMNEETYAYSLEEVIQMLAMLPEVAKAAVGVAAFAGLRRGEIRGLRWEDYAGETLQVRRSVWRLEQNDPKTEKSKAPVPVIAPLRKLLDPLKKKEGFIFETIRKNPMDLNMLALRLIRPALQAHGMEWHGWHAFRRGLATNLHRLGVQDKLIQAILRHGTISVTQNVYIKAVPVDVIAAMKQLEIALEGAEKAELQKERMN